MIEGGNWFFAIKRAQTISYSILYDSSLFPYAVNATIPYYVILCNRLFYGFYNEKYNQSTKEPILFDYWIIVCHFIASIYDKLWRYASP